MKEEEFRHGRNFMGMEKLDKENHHHQGSSSGVFLYLIRTAALPAAIILHFALFSTRWLSQGRRIGP